MGTVLACSILEQEGTDAKKWEEAEASKPRWWLTTTRTCPEFKQWVAKDMYCFGVQVRA